MLHTILPVLLLTGGILHLIQGIRTVLYPISFLFTFGLPSDASAADLAPAYGGRNVALSLTMVVLYFQGMYQAAGIMLMCCTIGAAMDTYVVSIALRQRKIMSSGPMYSHMVGFVVLALLGLGLVMLE